MHLTTRTVARLVLLLALLLLPTALYAQEILRIGEPFTIAATHTGAFTTEYQIETTAPGATAPVITDKLPVSALALGMIRFPYPTGLPDTLPIGTYTVVVVAVGEGGRARSTPIQLSVQPRATPPAAPGTPIVERPGD